MQGRVGSGRGFHAVSANPAGAIPDTGRGLRRRGYAHLADELVGKAPFWPDISKQRQNDLPVVLLGPEIYRSLVIEAVDHERWSIRTTNALLRDLFGLEPDTP